MSIVVPCPKCGTKLSAPDSAAGKHVRCPKFGCAAAATVPAIIPAEEIEVVDATPASPKLKPASADEDDEEDRPRKKSQRDDDDRSRSKRRSDEDSEPPRKQRRWMRDDDYERDRPNLGIRRNAGAGMGAGAIVALIFGGLVLLGGVGVGIYALAGKKTSPSNGEDDNNSSLIGFGDKKSHRPKGRRLDGLSYVDEPAIVDAAWSKLLGKWELFPNPHFKATYEFHPDFSITEWISPPGEREINIRKTVAIISDRSSFSLPLNVIQRGDRHYELIYATPPNVFESGSFIVCADGTITGGGNDHKYYRIDQKGPDGAKSPPVEEVIWLQLVGKQWSMDSFSRTHIIEFRKDKTVSSKLTVDRTLVQTIEGKVTEFK